jgi:hypothetical protein
MHSAVGDGLEVGDGVEEILEIVSAVLGDSVWSGNLTELAHLVALGPMHGDEPRLPNMVVKDPKGAERELKRYLRLIEKVPSGELTPAGNPKMRTRGTADEITSQAYVVRRIYEHLFEGEPHRITGEHARIALVELRRGADIDDILGTSGPSIQARQLHPWVWDAARPAWEAGQYEDAVDAAARNINSRMRAKSGRKDISERELVGELFSLSEPQPGKPRLRLDFPEHTADKTVRAIYGGLSEYGRGLYSAVRNPLAHEAPGHGGDLHETEALETLAAFSLLARWVARGEVERAP